MGLTASVKQPVFPKEGDIWQRLPDGVKFVFMDKSWVSEGYRYVIPADLMPMFPSDVYFPSDWKPSIKYADGRRYSLGIRWSEKSSFLMIGGEEEISPICFYRVYNISHRDRGLQALIREAFFQGARIREASLKLFSGMWGD